MIGDLLYTCSVHGFVEAMRVSNGLDAQLVCTAPDPERPTGNCFRRVGGPFKDPTTGRIIETDGGPPPKDRADVTIAPIRPMFARKSSPPPVVKLCAICQSPMIGVPPQRKSHPRCQEERNRRRLAAHRQRVKARKALAVDPEPLPCNPDLPELREKRNEPDPPAPPAPPAPGPEQIRDPPRRSSPEAEVRALYARIRRRWDQLDRDKRRLLSLLQKYRGELQ